MCLVDKKQFRIAEKDIPIFKIVENKFGIIQAPFQHVPYKTLPIIESNVEVEPTFLAQQDCFQYGYGFIHAYLNEEIAKDNLNRLNFLLPGSRVFYLYQGHIPEGTRYAIEESSGYICARKIILNI